MRPAVAQTGMFSLIIPVYNEEAAVEETVRSAHESLARTGESFEIVVIDDGSNDGTGAILDSLEIAHLRVLRNPVNRGYGASLKRGIRRSRGDLLGITDADGTYPVVVIPELIRTLHDADADMVVGARTKSGAHIPLVRRPAKAIVAWLANLLISTRVPDVNSGLRVFRRDLAEQFMHLYPTRFSFTITITLAALSSDHHVVFVPIDYFERKGRSTLDSHVSGIANFLAFLGIVVRIVTYFRPLRFFVWPSAFLTLTGLGILAYTVATEHNVTDSGLLFLLAGLQVGLFGLLADVVARTRLRS
jgi:glycosyltransferase involved in cell wall biosynthesis